MSGVGQVETVMDRDGPGTRGEGAAGREDAAPMTSRVAVIVTLTERPEPLEAIFEEYAPVLAERQVSGEFIFAADTRYRHLLDEVEERRERGLDVRTVTVGQAVGEAALVERALQETDADVILTLPAYFRVEAGSLSDLIDEVEAGADVAVARRHPRIDSWINRLQTRAFHALLRRITRGSLHDVACGVRAVRRHVLEQMPLYGDFFRFFPLFAAHEGFRVEELDAPQHRADRQTRVYRPGTYLRRLLDVLGVFFLLRFTWKPLRFFGLAGSVLGGAGSAVLLVLFFQRIGGQGIADRPLLLLGVLLLVLGVQAVALGLIGEIIVHLHAPSRKRYRVSERVGGGGDEG